jgi:hypothetical protein
MSILEIKQTQPDEDVSSTSNKSMEETVNSANKTQQGSCDAPGMPCSIVCSPLWLIPCCVSSLLTY